MIAVPDEKTITGLTRTELIAMIRALEKELDTALTCEVSLAKQAVALEEELKALRAERDQVAGQNEHMLTRLEEVEKERDEYKARGGW